MSKKLDRRKFLSISLGGLAAATLTSCQKKADQVVNTLTPTPRTLPVSPTSMPDATTAPLTPTPTAVEPVILRNQNRPDVKPNWNVRFYKSFEAVDHQAWRLSIDGHVEQPQTLSLDDLLTWSSITQVSRMKCVECWSAKAKWQGFTYQTLAERVKPTSEAKWIHFECADGYYEALPIEVLDNPRVLWAYKMDDEMLLDQFGAPLRLIVPALYGYKGAKTITNLRFQGTGRAGYWPTVGPYTREGYIEAGVDYPLDLEGSRQIDGGEITDY